MLKKIYQELLLIRKELQAIRSSMESSSFVPEDSDGKHCGSRGSCANPR
ncbi:Uncharacterised protein [[Eubacterium] contortum]|uniref:Uncharacterized protein n=1 Tax=Faecalicatena contorta TaxID=39482 RepID=A0A174FTV9_9FIRM|nr:Uncharacterised protein [[Eubacterium] contortum] [Faecalicatena contorta]